MIDMTLAILAGGKSSRMGRNKALLKYKEKTFIENIINEGKKFSEILIISNDKEEYKNLNCKILQDIYKNKGPLGGIYTALKNSTFDKVICVACDMPLISEETLIKLSKENIHNEIVIPKIAGKLQPLCGVYNKSLIYKIEKNIKEGKIKLIDNIKDFEFKILDEKVLSEKDFFNINTLEDYRKLEGVNVQGWHNNK